MTKKTYDILETASTTEVGQEHVSFTISSGFDKSPFDRTDETRESVDMLGRVRRTDGDGSPRRAAAR